MTKPVEPRARGSLRGAIGALEADKSFLKKGNVFSDDLIDSYLERKWKEICDLEHTPHPVEYKRYYSV